MQLTETIKLYPNKRQRSIILDTMRKYIACVNQLTTEASSGVSISDYTSKGVTCALPSAIKNQCIRDAKSIMRKHRKFCKKAAFNDEKEPNLPVLKKPCFFVNNQNFTFRQNNLSFPVEVDGKTTRLSIRTILTENQRELISSRKLGTLRVVLKGDTIVAQVVYEQTEAVHIPNENVMGVDLGIKCPAVSYCSDGAVKFHGNGRQNKYLRRKYNYLRKQMQDAKKLNAAKRINNKEQRIMRDIDHKISREIVNTAIKHNVSVIKLEQLENVRSSTRKSRKNNHSLHTWSFYRLAMFIEYKAKLAGISVEYVNPAYTSQMCPCCGTLNHATDRDYKCDCGYHVHRDLLGAINIHNSTEYVGNRYTA